MKTFIATFRRNDDSLAGETTMFSCPTFALAFQWARRYAVLFGVELTSVHLFTYEIAGLTT